MKISCNVIRDILPLYVEDLASEESRKIVEDHIDECEDCKKDLEEMRSSSDIPPVDIDTRPIEKVRDKIKREKTQSKIFASIVAIVVVIALIAFLTAPDYLNDVTSFSIVENPEGTVVANFREDVTGYDLEKNWHGYVITTWNSFWTRNIHKRQVNSIVLNPQGEDVESVYYNFTDGRQDALKYGKNQFENGGIITLPRLALSYYLTIALGLILICLVVIRIFRNNKKIKDSTKNIMGIPVAYILGHILIKGFKTSTYSIQRDFFAIILAMFAIYAAMQAFNKLRERKS